MISSIIFPKIYMTCRKKGKQIHIQMVEFPMMPIGLILIFLLRFSES
jgi:hypothetical protein